MAKKPNAANITHGLAQIGGGAKKDGGGGMLAGLQSIFEAGANYQKAIGNNQNSAKIKGSIPLMIDEGKDNKKK